MFELISFSIDIAVRTKGIFDPTIIDILEAYGYNAKDTFSANSKSQIKQTLDLQEYLRTRPKYNQIELNQQKRQIKLMQNQRIDLGAIGKGYAIDLAFDVLDKKFNDFIINAGGDIRLKGLNSNKEKWKVKLEYSDEVSTKNLGYVELSEGSICCSGGFARKVGSFHHLINPKSGIPEDKIIVSYILANKAITADTFSTVSYLIGEDIQKFCKDFQIEYFVLNKDGSEFISSGFPLKNI